MRICVDLRKKFKQKLKIFKSVNANNAYKLTNDLFD